MLSDITEAQLAAERWCHRCQRWRLWVVFSGTRCLACRRREDRARAPRRRALWTAGRDGRKMA